jgi:TPR repeat protein
MSVYRHGADAVKVTPAFAWVRGKRFADAGDYRHAACWFYLGGAQGDARSMGDLAFLQRKGLGVNQNLDAALGWLQHGASIGDALSAQQLAEMYEHGDGVAKDSAQAARLHALAAKLKKLGRSASTARTCTCCSAWPTSARRCSSTR